MRTAQSKAREQQHGLEKPNVQDGNKGQNSDRPAQDQESPMSLLNTMIKERSGRAS